ncbi:MAG: YafY family protein [Bacteroidota bacterium]
MNTSERRLAILLRLQNRKLITAEALAEVFDVSVRTIYRDMRSLEAAGVPLGAEAGKGYYLADGFNLPPVMLSRKEASALLLSHKLVAEYTDPSLSEAHEEAMEKIKAVLDPEALRDIERLEASVQVRLSYQRTKAQGPWLAEIQRSLRLQQPVRMTYLRKHPESRSARVVEPIGLCYYSNSWHLIGWCQLREAYLDFRADRIEDLVVLPSPFTKSDHITLTDYFDQLAQTYPVHLFEIRFTAGALPFVGDFRYVMGFVDETPQGDGTVLMRFLYPSIDGFARWILTYTDQVEIIGPEELKVHFSKLIHALVEHTNIQTTN